MGNKPSSSAGSGRVVLITGCSAGGIGYSLAREFAKRGCIVYATARQEKSMEGLGQLQGMNLLTLDVTSSDSIKAAVQKVVLKEGRIDVLVNNAGISAGGPVAEMPIKVIRQVFDTNLFGAIELAQEVFPHMAAQRNGLIVNVGSVAGYVHRPWKVAYSASKAALHVATNNMRMEMRPFGINVLLLTPGYVTTNIFANGAENTRQAEAMCAYKTFENPAIKKPQGGADPAGTPVDVFSKKVVSVALQPSPPWRFAMGKMSTIALFAGALPIPIIDWAFSKMYGLPKSS
eukprot:TRINITY_DN2077_c0_g2_i1.p1 TRINITY_DN2077_c0_g2~~TRINITY_DN2077_c0_g2_i1.p1  ORF type:complete len:288 (-),score=55.53 TRINITY_DN2077_c0_g2_i1:186-1049(-)